MRGTRAASFPEGLLQMKKSRLKLEKMRLKELTDKLNNLGLIRFH